MSERLVLLTITHIEARHLAGLVAQFGELLDDTESDGAGRMSHDPAIARLAPSAYPHDDEAADDFRRATQSDLLGRRAQDAARVLRDLTRVDEGGDTPADPDDAERPLDVALDDEGVRAWMRTLTAIRLVIASRLGIVDEDDRDEGDPRFGVYDWLGYRLEGLIQASDI